MSTDDEVGDENLHSEDTIWADGPNIGPILAEAVAAYAVWRATPKGGIVFWPSGVGHDIVATYRELSHRINAKSAWRNGAPPGKFYCAPLTRDQPLHEKENVDIFALVVLGDDDLSWQYEQHLDGTVKLEARARSSDIYYLPLDKAVELHAVGELGPDGASRGRWIVTEAALTSCRILPFPNAGDAV